MVFFGTGFHNAASARGNASARVTCAFHGVELSIVRTGPQVMPGVDQITVRIPEGTPFAGTGVVLTVNGVVTNAVYP